MEDEAAKRRRVEELIRQGVSPGAAASGAYGDCLVVDEDGRKHPAPSPGIFEDDEISDSEDAT